MSTKFTIDDDGFYGRYVDGVDDNFVVNANNSINFQFTQQHADQGRQTYKKWRSAALSTEPADRAAVEQAFRSLYAAAHIPNPNFSWQPSPAKGLAQATIAISQDKNLINATTCIQKDVSAFQRQIPNDRIRNAIFRELKSKINTDIVNIRDVVQEELLVRAHIIEETKPRIGRCLKMLLEKAQSGLQHAGDLAIVDFANALNIIHSDNTNYLNIGHCGWFWTFNDLVVITERPTTIHFSLRGKLDCDNGPAIEYSDGFAIYCRDGSHVPKSAVVSPKEIEWSEVEAAPDSDVRGAVARAKVDDWAKQGEAEGESEEERQAAAAAAARLAGITGVAGLARDDE